MHNPISSWSSFDNIKLISLILNLRWTWAFDFFDEYEETNEDEEVDDDDAIQEDTYIHRSES